MRYDNFDLFDIIYEKLTNVYFDMKDYECDKDLVKNLDRLFRVAEALDIKITNDFKIITWDYDTVDKLIKEIENKYNVKYERKEDESFYSFIYSIDRYYHNFYLSKQSKVLYAKCILDDITSSGIVYTSHDIDLEMTKWLKELEALDKK